MIVCESIQYVEHLSQNMGVGCLHVDIFSQLDRVVTAQAVGDLLMAQWAIYIVILSYAWVRYAIIKAKF